MADLRSGRSAVEKKRGLRKYLSLKDKCLGVHMNFDRTFIRY